jgi:hypothetical protein
MAVAAVVVLGNCRSIFQNVVAHGMAGGSARYDVFNRASVIVSGTNAGCYILLSGLLLWAGLACWKRQRHCATLHICYSVLSTIMVLSWPIVQYCLWQALTSENTTTSWNPFGNPFGQIHWATWAASAVPALGYPIFVFVWFVRPRIRAVIAMWGQPIGPSPAPAIASDYANR